MEGEQEEGVAQTIPKEEGESLVKQWKHRLAEMPKRSWYLLTLVGIFLLILASKMDQMKQEAEPPEQDSVKSGTFPKEPEAGINENGYAAYIEQRLQTVLSAIAGVGETEVFVTLRSSAEKVIDKEYNRSDDTLEETDSGGGNRKDRQVTYEERTVLVGEGGGMPYVLQEMAPEIEGILIVAEGAESPVIAEQITDAMSALFGVSPHKIRVLKKKSS